MSETVVGTLKEAWGLKITSLFPFLGTKLTDVEIQGSGVKIYQPSQSDATSLTETLDLPSSELHKEVGLASLLGKYNNDTSWEDFPAWLEQHRRQIDEMNK